jgi:hypothetical protein
MNVIANYYRALADATDVELQAMTIQLSAMKRRRDAFREMEKFFTPPPTPSLGTPLPVLPSIGPDPDFDDDAPGQEHSPERQP